MNIFLSVIVVIVAAAAIAASIYAYRNMHYDEKPLRETYSAVIEKNKQYLMMELS